MPRNDRTLLPPGSPALAWTAGAAGASVALYRGTTLLAPLAGPAAIWTFTAPSLSLAVRAVLGALLGGLAGEILARLAARRLTGGLQAGRALMAEAAAPWLLLGLGALLQHPAAVAALPLGSWIARQPWLLPLWTALLSVGRLRPLLPWEGRFPTVHPTRWILTAALLLHLSTAVQITSRTEPTGDEPQYIRIARSLWEDGDADLTDDVPGYHRLWPPDWCRLHHLLRRGDGHVFSIHAVGLPALIAPALALAGRGGAAVLLALLAAWWTLEAFRLAHGMTGDPGTSALAAFAASASLPMAIFPPHLYPELPAGLIALVVLRRLMEPELSRRQAILAGLGIGLLPLLHMKYAMIAACLGGAALLLQGRRALRPALVLPVAAGLSLLPLYYWWSIGSPNPLAAYSSYAQTTAVVDRTAPWGLVTHLLDPRYGLLPLAPLFLLVPAGMLRLGRRSGRVGTALLLAGVPYFLVLCSHASIRWLGFSPPGRFLVPLMGLTVPALAAAASGPGGRRILLSLTVPSVLLGRLLLRQPRMIHHREDLIRHLSDGGLDWGSLWPAAAGSRAPRELAVGLAVLILLGLGSLMLAAPRFRRLPIGSLIAGWFVLTALLPVPGLLVRGTVAGSLRSDRVLAAWNWSDPELRARPVRPLRFSSPLPETPPPKPRRATGFEILSEAELEAMARSALAAGEPIHATGPLEEALRRQPGSLPLQLLLAETYFRWGSWEQSTDLTERLLQRDLEPSREQEVRRWRQESRRNLGIALAWIGTAEGLEEERRAEFLEQAEPLLTEHLTRSPEDREAREALQRIRARRDRP